MDPTWKQLLVAYALAGEKVEAGYEQLAEQAENADNEIAAENAHANADEVRRARRKAARYASRLPD